MKTPVSSDPTLIPATYLPIPQVEWRFEESYNSPSYVPPDPKLIADKDIYLPTRQIELWELSLEDSNQSPELPKQLKNMQVFIPKTQEIVAAYKAGHINKIAMVNVYEVGKKYLLYRTLLQTNNDSKRKLVIYAHGCTESRRFAIPQNITIAFMGPHYAQLITANPLLMQNIPAYSEHKMGMDGKNEITIKGVKEISEDGHILADGSLYGNMYDVSFSKIGSPIYGAKTKLAQDTTALNNANEMAAWAAHELGKDMLILRQRPRLLPTTESEESDASLADVLNELTKTGLLAEYDRIEVYACRVAGFYRNPDNAEVYGIGNNLKE